MSVTRRKKRVTPARKAGRLLLISGLVIPLIGIVVAKSAGTADFVMYRRILQFGFSGGTMFLIAGILVRSYWPDGEPRKGPINLSGLAWSLVVFAFGFFFVGGILAADQSNQFSLAIVMGASLLAAMLLFQINTAIRKRYGGLASAAKREDLASAAEEESQAQDTPEETPGEDTPGKDTLGEEALGEDTPFPTAEGFLLTDERVGQRVLIGVLLFFVTGWYGGIFYVISQNGLHLLLLVALLAGFLPLYGLFYFVRDVVIFERRSELVLDTWPLVAGDEIGVIYRRALKRNFTATDVDAALRCLRITKGERRGDTVDPDKTETLGELNIPVRDFTQEGKQIQARWKMTLPPDWRLPVDYGSIKIYWGIAVIITLAEGPKGEVGFTLPVRAPASVPEPSGDSARQAVLPFRLNQD